MSAQILRLKESLEFLRPDYSTRTIIPYFSSGVAAGFPSPADDYLEGFLDLNRHLINNPAATIFARAMGDSMEGVGMYDGDILIVDRSLEAKDSSIVVAIINGDFTVKQLRNIKGEPWLYPANDKYKPLKIMPEMDFQVFGVIEHWVRMNKKK